MNVECYQLKSCRYLQIGGCSEQQSLNCLVISSQTSIHNPNRAPDLRHSLFLSCLFCSVTLFHMVMGQSPPPAVPAVVTKKKKKRWWPWLAIQRVEVWLPTRAAVGPSSVEATWKGGASVWRQKRIHRWCLRGAVEVQVDSMALSRQAYHN